MLFELNSIALPYGAATVIALLVAVLVFTKQSVKGGFSLGVLMLQLALWGGASAVRWSLLDMDAQIFWLKLSHIAFVAAPLTFLIFIAQLTDTDRWLTNSNLILLAVEPLTTMFVIAANASHGLFYASFGAVVGGGFRQIDWERGPWFWFNSAWSYLLILAAAITLFRAILRASPYIRVQLLTVLIGCLLPWSVNAYALLSPAAARQAELTPLAAVASGAIVAYALLRQRLLDVAPVARSRLFENLGDGVLVVDTAGRVVDFNKAARRMLLLKDEDYGRSINAVLPQWAGLGSTTDLRGGETHLEVQGRIDPSRFYDVSVVPLLDSRARPNGLLVSMRDVSQQRQAEQELHKMNLRLRRQMHKIGALHEELLEQTIRDSLTDLYNRRYMDETLKRELSRARRSGYPISVIMLDVDRFKAVNDTYGHKAGDRVLRALGELIRTQVRSGDIPCRSGGEEFVIIMPETPLQIAFERAEDIRARFASMRFFRGSAAIVPSLSLGVAVYPTHGRSEDKLLHAADIAMYTAKAYGGNKAVRYDSSQKTSPVPAARDRPR